MNPVRMNIQGVAREAVLNAQAIHDGSEATGGMWRTCALDSKHSRLMVPICIQILCMGFEKGDALAFDMTRLFMADTRLECASQNRGLSNRVSC